MPDLDEINEDIFASAVTDEEPEAPCSTQLTVPSAAYVTFCCPPSRYAGARTAAGLDASGACPIRRGPNTAAGRRERRGRTLLARDGALIVKPCYTHAPTRKMAAHEAPRLNNITKSLARAGLRYQRN